MIRRAVFTLVAAFMLATGGAVLVVALSFAAYQALKIYAHMDPAAAGATLAGIIAVVLIVAGLVMARKAAPPRTPELSPLDRALEALKERPIISAVAALAAMVIAVRNPSVVATVVASFLGPRPPQGR